jgi:hypothetical protein
MKRSTVSAIDHRAKRQRTEKVTVVDQSQPKNKDNRPISPTFGGKQAGEPVIAVEVTHSTKNMAWKFDAPRNSKVSHLKILVSVG